MSSLRSDKSDSSFTTRVEVFSDKINNSLSHYCKLENNKLVDWEDY